ncbi:hypothetical protein H7H82_23690 [Mycobacterium heidelbergense]|uniref:hypothetical protein n=1 Tax=Mycobacterium heidelbergense TaxID=53376 RepID=UPI001301C9A4|nr:hypothetical protein [Mycobacterium heidelbergense]MCV7053561.1 hypothetical protein [Mycobacterium heidelbergense]
MTSTAGGIGVGGKELSPSKHSGVRYALANNCVVAATATLSTGMNAGLFVTDRYFHI